MMMVLIVIMIMILLKWNDFINGDHDNYDVAGILLIKQFSYFNMRDVWCW